jgi:hypothetical protein
MPHLTARRTTIGVKNTLRCPDRAESKGDPGRKRNRVVVRHRLGKLSHASATGIDLHHDDAAAAIIGPLDLLPAQLQIERFG